MQQTVFFEFQSQKASRISSEKIENVINRATIKNKIVSIKRADDASIVYDGIYCVSKFIGFIVGENVAIIKIIIN